MSNIHFFNVAVATKYGINAAILLENIAFWIEKNEANGVNFFDGRYWTYNSIKAFCEMFPYMSPKTIRTTLKKLEDEGLIITGNYNQSSYDRTTWYAFTEKGKSICPKGKMDLPEMENGLSQKGKPIPDNKHTDNKPDIKPDIYISTPNGVDTSHSASECDAESVSDDAKKVVEAWNTLGLHKVTKLQAETTRYILLSKRLKDYGVDEVLRAVENVRNSDFLKGKNRRGFVCTFDWFIKPNNFPKVLDGNYNEEARETFPHDSSPYKGAAWLDEQITTHTPSKKPRTELELQQWAEDINAIHEEDGYDWDVIARVLGFSQRDDFYRPIILSGNSLRKHFETMLSRCENEGY